MSPVWLKADAAVADDSGMASPSPQTDAADALVTVVLIDSSTPEALARCAQQVQRTGEGCGLVIVTARALHLPSGIARRSRQVRVAAPEELELVAAVEASAPHLVVVAPTSAAFSRGWRASVLRRTREHSQVISVVGVHGRSIIVVPPSVQRTTGTRTTWLYPEGLRLREVAAVGGSQRQSLSAVMIVKDEEDVLDECLTALAPFVDEIVVYDTGSTDGTLEIARRHGVVLVEGYWNDHFGEARNRALQHATGDWALQIDADEVMTGDVEALRRQLDTEVHDQVSLTIVSTTFQGGSTGVESQPARLFRRDRYEWTGALHEYPQALPGITTAGMSPMHAPVRVFHSGYQPERTAARDKASRNLALSTKELEATPAHDSARATLLSNQGRTLMWAGKIDEAIEVFDELRRTPGNPTSIVIAGRAAMEALLGTGRLDEVEPWLEVLAANGESPGNIAFFRARRHVQAGDLEASLAAVAAITPGGGGTDIWGLAFDEARIAVVEAAAELGRGNARQATDLLVGLVQSSPDAVPFGLLLTAMTAAGRSLEEVTAVAPESFLERTLREAAATHPVQALAWFEAYHATHPTDVRAAVAGNVFAARAGWRVALMWAIRGLEAGLPESNALASIAQSVDMPLVERCIAAALLCEYFNATDMASTFEKLTSNLAPREEADVMSALAEMGISTSSATAINDPQPIGASA